MKFWQVDAFTHNMFSGNPAAVFIFDKEPSDHLMQNIAKEMNLSETAFIIQEDHLKIRWFTPSTEVNLCGHATLSAAHILWEENLIKTHKIVFQSKSGPLSVVKQQHKYTLDFPLQPPKEKNEYVDCIYQMLKFKPEYIGANSEDCMVIIKDHHAIYNFIPDYQKICTLEERGFLLAAEDPSKEFDYIYRSFFPKLNILEDPVTGSANTCLAAYFSKKLNKQKLKAYQASERGGHLEIEVLKDRVLITGEAITVFSGNMMLNELQF